MSRKWLVVVAGIALFAAGVTVFARIQRRECRDLGSLDSFTEESVRYFECVPLFVVHSGDNYYALLALSTHMPSEPVEWNRDERLFISPFHGEAFDIRGNVIKGPANGPLEPCPLVQEDGHLFVDVPTETEDEDIRRFCIHP